MIEVNSPHYWNLRHAAQDWPRWSAWALKIPIANIPYQGTVLEIGCGQGAACIQLMKHRPDLAAVIGMDIAPEAIKKANSKLGKIFDSCFYRVRFDCADLFENITDDCYAKETFDYVITIQNMEHWPLELHDKAISTMFDLLKPNGNLFFTGVNMNWSLDKQRLMPINNETVETDLHYCKWSEQTVYDLMVRNGARAVTFYPSNVRPCLMAEGTK
jgi:SAM-dependent methyltransferase